jgi:hypothetical protein
VSTASGRKIPTDLAMLVIGGCGGCWGRGLLRVCTQYGDGVGNSRRQVRKPRLCHCNTQHISSLAQHQLHGYEVPYAHL